MRTIRAFVIMAALSSASVAAGPSAPAAREVPRLPGRVVQVTAAEYSFRSPDTLPAGLTTFVLRQEGRVLRGAHLSPAARDSLVTEAGDPTAGFHMLWIVQLDSGKMASDFFAAVNTNQPHPWARNHAGPGFAFPPRSANATLSLEPGNYVLVCYVGSAREDRSRYHLLKGMFRPLTVVPSRRKSARLPIPDLIVTLRDEDSVQFSRPITRPGVWRILARNASATGVELRLLRVLPGHTAAEALAWRRRDGKPPLSEPWGGTSSIPPGSSVFTTVEMPPGTYILNGRAVAIRDKTRD